MLISLKKKARSILGNYFADRLSNIYHLIRFNQAIRKIKFPKGKCFDLVFYCEQPSHWQNICGVANKLTQRLPGLNYCLITSYAENDYQEAEYPKNLLVLNALPQSLRYINGKLLYTPYVGFNRSILRKVDTHVIHSLVSLTSLDGVYRDDMFDGYDYILCAGPHHIEDFKNLVLRRPKIKNKILIPAGYPKLDLSIRWANSKELSTTKNFFTIVYAPTHVYEVNERLASLRSHGYEIVKRLLESGYSVIFRPHPVSFRDQDSGLVKKIAADFSSNERFMLDRSKEYRSTYLNADLMITDFSGTGFTFSLSFEKPAIFMSPNPEAELGLKGIQFKDREQIGGVASTVDEMLSLVGRLRQVNMSERIKTYRKDNVFNVGNSDDYIVDCLTFMLNGRTKEEWVHL